MEETKSEYIANYDKERKDLDPIFEEIEKSGKFITDRSVQEGEGFEKTEV